MLEIILMLLGLAFPNSDTNTVTSDDPNQTTIENTQSVVMVLAEQEETELKIPLKLLNFLKEQIFCSFFVI